MLDKEIWKDVASKLPGLPIICFENHCYKIHHFDEFIHSLFFWWKSAVSLDWTIQSSVQNNASPEVLHPKPKVKLLSKPAMHHNYSWSDSALLGWCPQPGDEDLLQWGGYSGGRPRWMSVPQLGVRHPRPLGDHIEINTALPCLSGCVVQAAKYSSIICFGMQKNKTDSKNKIKP